MSATWKEGLSDPGPWAREKGTARGYYSLSTGLRLSRNQYDKMREFMGQRGRFDMLRLKKQQAVQATYNSQLKSYVQAKRKEGIKINKAQARQSAEFKQIHRDLTWLNTVIGRDNKGHPIRRRDTPEGRLRLRDDLIALGRRQGIPNWVPPGLSDKWRQGKLRPSRIAKKWRMA